MKNMKFALKSLASLMILASAPSASAAELVATDSGWCINNKWCNGVVGNGLANYFVGTGEPHENWFVFDIPFVSFESASINIFNTQSSIGGVYRLYQTRDVLRAVDPFDGSRIFFDNGSPIAEIAFADIPTANFVSIELNQAGIEALNGSMGRKFQFGGVATQGFAFGSTQGAPAPFLSFTGVPAVPEPSTWAMMIFGFFTVGGLLRSKRRNQKHTRFYI